RLEMADRFVASPALLCDDAEEITTHISRGINLQAVPCRGGRLVETAGVHHQLGKNLVTLSRIALNTQFGMLARQRRLPLEPAAVMTMATAARSTKRDSRATSAARARRPAPNPGPSVSNCLPSVRSTQPSHSRLPFVNQRGSAAHQDHSTDRRAPAAAP